MQACLPEAAANYHSPCAGTPTASAQQPDRAAKPDLPVTPRRAGTPAASIGDGLHGNVYVLSLPAERGRCVTARPSARWCYHSPPSGDAGCIAPRGGTTPPLSLHYHSPPSGDAGCIVVAARSAPGSGRCLSLPAERGRRLYRRSETPRPGSHLYHSPPSGDAGCIRAPHRRGRLDLPPITPRRAGTVTGPACRPSWRSMQIALSLPAERGRWLHPGPVTAGPTRVEPITPHQAGTLAASPAARLSTLPPITPRSAGTLAASPATRSMTTPGSALSLPAQRGRWLHHLKAAPAPSRLCRYHSPLSGDAGCILEHGIIRVAFAVLSLPAQRGRWLHRAEHHGGVAAGVSITPRSAGTLAASRLTRTDPQSMISTITPRSAGTLAASHRLN